jgi:carbamoyltransferase
MSITILGISAFYHDAAAALVRDGAIVAAAQEERFAQEARSALSRSTPSTTASKRALSMRPNSTRSSSTTIRWPPSTASSRTRSRPGRRGAQFIQGAGQMLGDKVWVEDHVRRAIGTAGRVGKVLFSEHHMAHAASAFYPSPFERAAILTIDGVGEWATTSLGSGDGNTVRLFSEINYPHSLGLLYSALTYFCGFKVNSGEYKLMGLAPYGQPIYYQAMLDHLIDVRADGSYRLDTAYFGYLDAMVMTNERFAQLFGGPPRQPESPITRREMDLAASIQKLTEEIVLRTARHLRAITGETRLVLAGGVALNCVANGKIVAENIFDEVWIQPAAGDAGGALGAALHAHHMYFGHPRIAPVPGRDAQQGSYLGPRYASGEVLAFLDRHGYPHQRIADQATRLDIVARALAEGKIVGWFCGRMEFGPRALGARSILGDPRKPSTQATMNLKIKYRESFRPFAPSVLRERCADYFELQGESPYMLVVAPVRPERRLAMDMSAFDSGDDDMRAMINQPRSDIPAVTHVDYSARIQTVDAATHPEYHALIKAFEAITGCPMLVNTSFNVRGEPIVCTPEDAYRCFMRTEMDMLVLEDVVLWRHAQPGTEDNDDWRSTYELD